MQRADPGIPLDELIAALAARGLLRSVRGAERPGGGDVTVGGVAFDSRAVAPGDVFCAIPGHVVDGHAFCEQAVAAGAVVVIAQRAVTDVAVPQLIVTATRPALALAAATLHRHPSHGLGVVGVTGTDGKTTTSFLIRAILEACGQPTGLVGTIEATAGGRRIGAGRQTTPEAPELQAYLAAMRQAGDRFAVIESTSHGLALDKVAEVAYDIAVLTNVTHEHLEFHGTHDAYRAAKRRLFESLCVGPTNPEKGWGKWAVVNDDEPVAEEFGAAGRSAGATVLGYGTSVRSEVAALDVAETADGLRLAVRTPRWQDEVRLALSGRFNVHNALAAVSVGEALGLPPDGIVRGLESVTHVPGRMQRIDAGQPFGVIVDYAHTANALAKVLDTLRPMVADGGGLICVFGSAGERDTLKRPMMGRVAGERCRVVVLTDEDPRGEDRLSILEDICAGATAAGRQRDRDVLLIPDRAAAIRAAIRLARPTDVVVLCGKGHEQTIEMADGPLPWDDAAVAREALAELGFER